MELASHRRRWDRFIESYPLLQSASAQYTAPGTRRFVGTGTCSAVFAMFAAMVEFPHGAVVPVQVPSAGPPAS